MRSPQGESLGATQPSKPPSAPQSSVTRNPHAPGNSAHRTKRHSATTGPNRRQIGEPAGAPSGGVVYLVPAVITVKSAAREIATGEAPGAVRVRSVREWVHMWTVARSGGSWGATGRSVDKCPKKRGGHRRPAGSLVAERVQGSLPPQSLSRRDIISLKRGTLGGT